MKVRASLAWLFLALLSGCESCFNHDRADTGGATSRNERGTSVSKAQGPAAATGLAAQEASGFRGQGYHSSTQPIATGSSTNQAGPAADQTSLPIGAPCRIDLIRGPGKGEAYEGTIVRVENDAIVLSNVIYEGPMKRSRSPTLADLPGIGGSWFGEDTSIDWKRMPDNEVRIAKSEVSAVRILDHDPVASRYQR